MHTFKQRWLMRTNKAKGLNWEKVGLQIFKLKLYEIGNRTRDSLHL